MGISIVTPAASDPVSLAEAKAHLRIDTTDENDLITSLITAATELAQTVTCRQFIHATFDYTLDRFPVEDYIELPRSPLSSVTSITYTNAGGTAGQTFTDITADTYHTPGRVVLNYDESWPDYREDYNAVVIRFVAGYGATSSSVPAAVRQAILLMVGHWFEHREEASEMNLKQMPVAAASLLATVKLQQVA